MSKLLDPNEGSLTLFSDDWTHKFVIMSDLSKGTKNIKLSHASYCIVPHVSVCVESRKHVLEQRHQLHFVSLFILLQFLRELTKLLAKVSSPSLNKINQLCLLL